MFWSLRENLCGLTHMRRGAGRIILGRSRLYYLDKLKARGFAVKPVLDDRGDTLNCRLCGFTNLSFDLAPGFEMTSCSSLALSVILHQEKLKLWSQGLPHSADEAMQRARELAQKQGGGEKGNIVQAAVVKGQSGTESIV